jgi:hypothetical protein
VDALERRYEVIKDAIESAVESEQPDGPALFKLETELRINYALVLIREALGLPPDGG